MSYDDLAYTPDEFKAPQLGFCKSCRSMVDMESTVRYMSVKCSNCGSSEVSPLERNGQEARRSNLPMQTMMDAMRMFGLEPRNQENRDNEMENDFSRQIMEMLLQDQSRAAPPASKLFIESLKEEEIAVIVEAVLKINDSNVPFTLPAFGPNFLDRHNKSGEEGI